MRGFVATIGVVAGCVAVVLLKLHKLLLSAGFSMTVFVGPAI